MISESFFTGGFMLIMLTFRERLPGFCQRSSEYVVICEQGAGRAWVVSQAQFKFVICSITERVLRPRLFIQQVPRHAGMSSW